MVSPFMTIHFSRKRSQPLASDSKKRSPQVTATDPPLLSTDLFTQNVIV